MPCLNQRDDESDDDSLGNILDVAEGEGTASSLLFEAASAADDQSIDRSVSQHDDDTNKVREVNEANTSHVNPTNRDLSVPFPTFGNPDFIQQSEKVRSKKQQQRERRYDMAGSPPVLKSPNRKDRHVMNARYISYPPTEAHIPGDIIVPEELHDQEKRNPVLFADTSPNPNLVSKFSRPLIEPWDKIDDLPIPVNLPPPDDLFRSSAQSDPLHLAKPRNTIKSKVIKKTLLISAGREDPNHNPPSMINLLDKADVKRRSVSRGGVRVVVDSHQILSNKKMAPSTYARRDLSSLFASNPINEHKQHEEDREESPADPKVQIQDFSSWLTTSLSQWTDTAASSAEVKSSVSGYLDYNLAFC
eukprot:TRINITY_DN36676_c0_g1_i1.p1 TRINITY_DN36676_c0_g1~~TRINITY_DN36676_c0_g1_i1.p1  ORF type:complete len:360 (+),score=71.85 TRINITY_DN36676_c0_g1_i1:43-1122(+)